MTEAADGTEQSCFNHLCPSSWIFCDAFFYFSFTGLTYAKDPTCNSCLSSNKTLLVSCKNLNKNMTGVYSDFR